MILRLLMVAIGLAFPPLIILMVILWFTSRSFTEWFFGC